MINVFHFSWFTKRFHFLFLQLRFFSLSRFPACSPLPPRMFIASLAPHRMRLILMARPRTPDLAFARPVGWFTRDNGFENDS